MTDDTLSNFQKAALAEAQARVKDDREMGFSFGDIAAELRGNLLPKEHVDQVRKYSNIEAARTLRANEIALAIAESKGIIDNARVQAAIRGFAANGTPLESNRIINTIPVDKRTPDMSERLRQMP